MHQAMDVEFNNASQVDTNGTGWFVGFNEWAKANQPGVGDLRYMSEDSLSRRLRVKWMDHEANDPNGTGKPKSEGRTISILVSERGRFRSDFSEDPGFPAGQTLNYVLENRGDFIIWGENLYHQWFVDEACSMLTVRWVPIGIRG
jgi:hypothetical protein